MNLTNNITLSRLPVAQTIQDFLGRMKWDYLQHQDTVLTYHRAIFIFLAY